MPDNLDLTADAIIWFSVIDQKVAGAFAGKKYAFVAVPADSVWGLGVAVADERGYNPVEGVEFTTNAEANKWADSLNAHIGLTQEQTVEIVVSTMRGPRSYRR